MQELAVDLPAALRWTSFTKRQATLNRTGNIKNKPEKDHFAQDI
jgi:hypothetical protein